VFVNTNYRTSGASALVSYIEQDHPLRNSAGRELSDQEVRGFIEKSDRHQFEREFQISPDPEADVSQRDLERHTQQFVDEFLADRPSVRAVYAYHGSTDIPHAHVAMTGKRHDLFVDREEITGIRQTLSQRLEQTQTQEQRQEQEHEQRQRQGLRVDQELEQVQSQRLELRPENQREQEQTQEQQQRQERDHGQDQDQGRF
jgi:hypothetical protein